MKKTIAFVAALALMCSLCVGAYAASFTDIQPGSWYYKEVIDMAADGIIDGYEDGSFRPERTVTVAEAVTMAARSVGAPTGELDGFWGGIQMDHAYRSGWISESDVTRSQYNEPVTRELACKIIASAFGIGYQANTVLPFTDAGSIKQSYTGSVLAMYSNGLIDGFEDGTFRPQSTLTRAQAAAMLYRANHIGETPDNDGYISASGYTADEIIDYFCSVALGAEEGEDFNHVIRWSSPTTCYVGGDYTSADIEKLDSLFASLNAVPGFPGIYRVDTETESTLQIYFVDNATMAGMFGGGYEGHVQINWYNASNEVYSGTIYISSELDRNTRDSVIVEETVQSLGLLKDTYDHPESIFYQYGSSVVWPCELDWAVINLLYSDAIRPGMTESDVKTAAASVVR